MARDWKNIKDKLQADGQGPSAADWEAMQAKIAAQPSLNPPARRPLWLSWAIAGALGVLLGWSTWYFMPLGQEQEELTVKPEIKATEKPAESVDLNQEMKSSSEELELKLKDNAEKIAVEPKLSNSTELKEGKRTSSKSELESLAKSEQSRREEALASDESAGSTAPLPLNQKSSQGERPSTDGREEQLPSENNNLPKPSLDLKPGQEAALSAPQASEEVSSETPSENKAGQIPPSVPALKDEASEKDPAETSEPKVDGNEAGEAKLPAAEEDFVHRNTGFRLAQANLSLSYLHDFNRPATYAPGLNFDLEWQKGAQFLSAGLAYHQLNLAQEKMVSVSSISIDSSYRQEIASREVIEVRRNWVIDSMFHGHYVYDTIRRTVVDTNFILEIDTNQYRSNFVRQSVKRFYYAELPIMYGYRWRLDRINIALAGGIALQQAVAYQDETSNAVSQFGMSALLQPQIAWSVSERWSLLGRVQMRYPLQESVLFEDKALRYSFQLGVSFHW